MCLMLYVATRSPLSLGAHGDLTIDDAPEDRCALVASAFSMQNFRFVGIQGGCSCGFPHVVCDEPLDYYEGMFEQDGEREQDIENVRQLLALTREVLQDGGEVEMFPAWEDGEERSPKGRIELELSRVKPEEFFFIEEFLYVVRP